MDTQLISMLILSIAIILILVLFFSFTVSLWKQLTDIKRVLYDNYVHFDPKIGKIVDLAVAHWRLKKQIEKINPSLSTEDKSRLSNSLRRIENYLHDNDIEVDDYTGRSANDGMNVNVMHVIHDPSVKKPIIAEVHTPAVKYKGKIFKKSDVIIINNSKDKE